MNKFKAINITAGALLFLSASFLATAEQYEQPAAPFSGVAALATKYICDEGKTFSVNFVLGARSATFDGKQWQNIEILDTVFRKDFNDEEHPATQYTFQNGSTRLYFMTAKGRASAGALLLPDSDDFLHCEVPL